MCLAQGPQHSDAGEAGTRGPSVSRQALYHWATALPSKLLEYRISTVLEYRINIELKAESTSLNIELT